MESEHTAEPWEDTDFYADMSQMVVGEHILSIPDYNRARVCVNAMQGIADPAEAMAKVREALQDCESLMVVMFADTLGVVPETVDTPIGVPLKVRSILATAREALALIGGSDE